MHVYRAFSYQANDRGQAWIGMAVLSAIFHALFIGGVMFLPGLGSQQGPRILPAVEVDLVSLPQGEFQGESSSGQKAAVTPLKDKPPLTKTEKVAVSGKPAKKRGGAGSKEEASKNEARPSQETVSLTSKPLRVKKSLKKKTYNVSKVISKAIERVAEKAPQSRPRPVLKAIDALEKEVEESGAGNAAGGAIAKTRAGKKTLDLLDIYHAEIWHRIQKNWAFSEELVQGRTDLEAVLIVKIMKGGKIRDLWFEKRSGNAYFDHSVLKAVKKSDPLPPLPEGFNRSFYEVGFRFNPSEIKGRP